MPADLKEKDQLDRIDKGLSGVSARFDELTARFEGSVNSIHDLLRTQSADLSAHNDQYNNRFTEIDRSFDAISAMLTQQSVRLTALEQTAGWVSAVMASMAAGGAATPSTSHAKQGGTPTYGVGQTGTAASSTGGSGGSGGDSGGAGGAGTTTPSTGTGGGTGTTTGTGTKTTGEALKYPDVSNASSYVGAGLQSGAAMFASPELARGWTQSLAFAPAAVGLVDDMVAEVDTKKALQRAAASALAGGVLLLAAKAIR
jgi:hypothetical protein